MKCKWCQDLYGWLLLAACLFAIVLVLFPPDSKADHSALHNRLMVGVPTKVKVHIVACDTREMIMRVVKAHEDGGQSAAELILSNLSALNEQGEPQCGLVNTQILVEEVFYETDLLFNGRKGESHVTVVSFRSPVWRGILYGALVGAYVEKGEVI